MNFGDKEKFWSNFNQIGQSTQISVREVNWDYNEPSYERLHTDFCKFSLGLTKYASTEACRGELGRYPLCNRIQSHMIKYWARMEQTTENLLLNKAFKCAKEEDHRWVQGIRCILKRNGMGEVWDNPSGINIKTIAPKVQSRLNDQFEQYWFANIRESNRFTILSDLRQTYESSNYLNQIKDTETRTIITRLRVDQNILEECKGRQKGIARELRMCPVCKNQTESVGHFLLYCPMNSEARQKVYGDIAKLTKLRMEYLPDKQKIDIFLNGRPPEQNGGGVENNIMEFIKSSYTKRMQAQMQIVE